MKAAPPTLAYRRSGATRGHYTDPPRRFDQSTYRDFDVDPFVGIRCDHCKAGLHDEHGNPRWEIDGSLRFVCVGGCR